MRPLITGGCDCVPEGSLKKLEPMRWSPEHGGGVVTQSAEPTRCSMSTTVLKRDLDTGQLCDNIGLVSVSAKWTASQSHHDQAIPILSPLVFTHVGHPYILFPFL